MTCAEHAFENALFAIDRKETYEEWLKDDNLKYTISDPGEIWMMANYVYWSQPWRHFNLSNN